jgi:ribonuclease HI
MAASRQVVLTFDGGSLGNPGRAYGSFRLSPGRGKNLPPTRLEFGYGTNNQAEYQALIAGLEAVLLWAVKSGHDPRAILVELRGDSQLVLNQLSGEWKVKHPDLRRLHSRARSLIDQFRRVEFIHQPRAVTVRVLGH